MMQHIAIVRYFYVKYKETEDCEIMSYWSHQTWYDQILFYEEKDVIIQKYKIQKYFWHKYKDLFKFHFDKFFPTMSLRESAFKDFISFQIAPNNYHYNR